MLITPAGCAHGVLTREDNTEYISYYSQPYDPANEKGIRYNDPLINIKWPVPIEHISEKDKGWADYSSQ